MASLFLEELLAVISSVVKTVRHEKSVKSFKKHISSVSALNMI
jgi:hypothetical protein